MTEVTLQEKYDTLEEKYNKLVDAFYVYRQESKKGVTFHFKDDTKPIFFPVFHDVNQILNTNETPVAFTLNFNEKDMARWLTDCHVLTQKPYTKIELPTDESRLLRKETDE